MSKEFKFVCCPADPKELENLKSEKYTDDEAVYILKKIAHPLRLKILRILTNQLEICTCELTQIFDESQPIVSRQLGILADSKILIRRVITQSGISGRWHAYSIHPEWKNLISHILQPFTRILKKK